MKSVYGAHSYGEIKIIGSGGDVHVGNYCSIASGVLVIMVGHRPDWITTYPFSDRRKASQWPEASGITGHPLKYGNLNVGNDVWIGLGVTLIGGITIGDGAIIAAGAVVAKDVKPFSIVAGCPAKLVRFRFTEDQISALLDIGWWNWPESRIRENLPLMCSDRIDQFISIHRGGL
jgi:acetyltransferase-like isoleucine patch superfamily enzyme